MTKPSPTPAPADGAPPPGGADPGDLLARALAAEGLYAFPPELALRIVALSCGTPDAWGGPGRRRAGWLELACRAAAAVVLAVAAWGALAGGLPGPGAAEAVPAWVAPPTPLAPPPALASAPRLSAPAAPWAAAAGLVLLGLSPWLARRLLAGPAGRGAGGAA